MSNCLLCCLHWEERLSVEISKRERMAYSMTHLLSDDKLIEMFETLLWSKDVQAWSFLSESLWIFVAWFLESRYPNSTVAAAMLFTLFREKLTYAGNPTLFDQLWVFCGILLSPVPQINSQNVPAQNCRKWTHHSVFRLMLVFDVDAADLYTHSCEFRSLRGGGCVLLRHKM